MVQCTGTYIHVHTPCVILWTTPTYILYFSRLAYMYMYIWTFGRIAKSLLPYWRQWRHNISHTWPHTHTYVRTYVHTYIVTVHNTLTWLRVQVIIILSCVHSPYTLDIYPNLDACTKSGVHMLFMHALWCSESWSMPLVRFINKKHMPKVELRSQGR